MDATKATLPTCDVCRARPAEGWTEATDASPELARCLDCAASTCGGFARFPQWMRNGAARAANPDRAALARELDMRAMRRAADALKDTQELERRLERQALADVYRDGRVMLTSARERRAIRERAIARRRDALNRAADYPMSGQELADATMHAALAARVPGEDAPDIAQEVARYVIRRSGPTPSRAQWPASGLKRLSVTLYLEKRRKDERATGARAAAKELAEWRRDDKRAARLAAAQAASADTVWALAADSPAPVATREPVSAESIAARLPMLSDGQRAALVRAITADDGYRRTRRYPLSATERVQWLNARERIRAWYPSVLAVRLAILPDAIADRVWADAVVAAAVECERKRAALTARGSGSVARHVSPAATSQLPMRLAGPATPRGPLPIIGETQWARYGDGYSGACSVAYLYRGRSLPRDPTG